MEDSKSTMKILLITCATAWVRSPKASKGSSPASQQLFMQQTCPKSLNLGRA